jgi:hypothetical protein
LRDAHLYRAFFYPSHQSALSTQEYFEYCVLWQVCGGPRGGECLLIGMKSGLIVKVWINNNFPNILYKHTSGIRCLDLSSQRVHLAIVDETANILVYDIEVNILLFALSVLLCDKILEWGMDCNPFHVIMLLYKI